MHLLQVLTYHTIMEYFEGTLEHHTLHVGLLQCHLSDSSLGNLNVSSEVTKETLYCEAACLKHYINLLL